MKAILALGLLFLLPQQPAKYDLLWKPKAGQKLVYAVSLNGTLAEAPFLFSADIQMRVTKVEKNGNYTIGTVYKNQIVKMLGETERVPDDPEELMRFDAKGHSLDPDEEIDEESEALSEIIGRAGEFEKPSKPVQIGDSWTHTYSEDKKLGLRKALATYKLVSVAKGNLQISLECNETTGADPTKIKGMVTIRESDGALVLVESAISKARVMEGLPPADLKLVLKLKN